jgi:large subunit ribosomal protein L17
MRHRKSGVKLNRTSSHRDAMFRNMVTSLLKHERIRTTDAKAKELRRWADHMVTLAKRGDLHARRQAMAIVREKNVVHKLFEEAQDKFGKRKGGYTRVIKLGRRPGDAAKLSMIELVLDETVAKKKTSAPKQKAAPAPEQKAEVKSDTPVEGTSTAVEETATAVEETATVVEEAATAADTEASSVTEATTAAKESTEEDAPVEEASTAVEEASTVVEEASTVVEEASTAAQEDEKKEE